MGLVGFYNVPLLDQAATAPLHHVWTDGQISVHPQRPTSNLKTGGHIQGESEAAWERLGSVASHLREVEGVVAGRKTLRLHDGKRVRVSGQSCSVFLPTLTVCLGRGQQVMPGAAASTHLPDAQTSHWTLRPCRSSRPPQSIVVCRQRLRADRARAQFQHDEGAPRELSIVLERKQRTKVRHTHGKPQIWSRLNTMCFIA